MPWQEILVVFVVFYAVKTGLDLYGKLFPPKNLSTEALSGKKLASDSNLFVVDIRTPGEWKVSGVIIGAHLVTFQSVDSFLSAVRPKLGKDQKLALICRSGNRSARAARKIAKRVNWAVIDIEGGMSRVVGEGYSPVRPTRAMGCESC